MTDIASILAPIKEALPNATEGPWIEAGPSYGKPLPGAYTSVVQDIGEDDDAPTICRDTEGADATYIATCNPERMSALIAAVEALQAERDALRDSLSTEISRSCASERDCIWQPHCAGAGKCLRPERPFDAALSAQTTKEA